MSNRKGIKEIFAKEFDAKEMRSQILKKVERKENRNMNRFLKHALPLCTIVIMCGILIINNKSNILKLEGKTTSDVKNLININNVDTIGEKRIDAITKDMVENNDFLDSLKRQIIVPQDLNKSSYYGIYTKSNKSKEYNTLNCYVYEYYNDNYKSIRISFAQNNKPIRDYYFAELGETSKINNVEIKIYHHKETYFTEFKYANYNFDIEVNNISLDELIKLIESIIK